MNAQKHGKRRTKMLTWLIAGFGGLLTVVVVLLIIGRFLPVGYGFEVRRTIAAPPDEVWAKLVDTRGFPLSGRMCQAHAEADSDNGLPAWTENLGASTVAYRTLASEAPRRLVISARDSVVPMSFESETTLVAVDAGTEVRVSTRGKIENGTWHVPIFRLIAHWGGMARKGCEQYLKSLDSN